ncbi:MAG: hypothetical protein HYZ48_05740 [Chlamydiales bacterium]|nr:hypothetical protein [Chlamydiales bacterium]
MKGKVLIALPFLLLSSCLSKSEWKVDEILSADKKFHSTRLLYPVHDSVREVELEFLKTQDHLYAYLNIHGIPIPSSDSKKVSVSIKTADQQHHFEAILRKGGQKIWMPDAAADLIIALLNQKQMLEITTCGYTTRVLPYNFDKLSKNIHHGVALLK